MNLVIVESPTKAKTLEKILGRNYTVLPSYGHIRDLPRKEIGVDVDHDYLPTYLVPTKAVKNVTQLKKAAKKADTITLATDPDREGEAIAWHLADVVGLIKGGKINSKCQRVIFHEITPSAVKEAFDAPRPLDLLLVDSQQARRILDRLVGYKLSPLLWRKVGPGLSAGRVQSVAVRLVVDRERERLSFKADEYWTIEALFNKDGKTFEASLQKVKGKKPQLTSEVAALKVTQSLAGATYEVARVTRSERVRRPAPPFTTSTLQQAASSKLGMGAKKTMRLAQELFEAGLITYHRTDSTILASSAVSALRKEIVSKYGKEYLPEKPVLYKKKAKLAQEAHEAIRPTAAEYPQNVPGEKATLLKLIWGRTTACQMKPAVYDQVSVDITPEQDYLFRVTGNTLKFPGFLKAYDLSEDSEEKESLLPPLEVGERLKLENLTPSQHFTQPPPRYTEASLVKDLEDYGIGRPSTYAPIISTIQERGYISRDGRYLFPEDVALVVTDLLKENFKEIVDVAFTARLEEEFDDIARGNKGSVSVIDAVYKPFSEQLKVADKTLSKKEVTTLEETDEKCPECNSPLVVKLGKYGRFLSCTAFPTCKYSHPLDAGVGGETVDEQQFVEGCDLCKGKLVLKEGRFGKFLACENYPKCKFTKNYLEKVGQKCPECEGEIVVKRTRTGRVFYGCSNYPNCKYASWKNPSKSYLPTSVDGVEEAEDSS